MNEVPEIDAEALSHFQPIQLKRRIKPSTLLDRAIFWVTLKQSFFMLHPPTQWKNPVMFVVEAGALLTLLFIIQMVLGNLQSHLSITYFIAIDAWLFLTVIFANFATALAEARGKAQAKSLREARSQTIAYRLTGRAIEEVSSVTLMPGDLVVVKAGQTIPSDGEIVEGIASVDESPITGESAPVVRAAGSDRSGVTGGTLVLSDRIVVRITNGPGHTFLDRMIALVEGAIRQRTPNEMAVTLVLSAFTLMFLIVVIPLWPMSWNAENYMMSYIGNQIPLQSLGTDVPTLVALLVCLIPTTIGALLAAIGIAGMDRALQANIIAYSGKAVELAGDIDVVLLDKTGTITLGNRSATIFLPIGKYTAHEVGQLAALASISDETPEGKSIVWLYEKENAKLLKLPKGSEFISYTAQTSMSGVDLPDGRKIRKGASQAIIKFVESNHGTIPKELNDTIYKVASKGATPLVIAEDTNIVGIVVLEDILKPHMYWRIEQLRKMGLKTIMITGDNPITAAAIAAKVGVDDFIAQATPEIKLAFIRNEQSEGKLVAMMGDGTNDAPALAQADVGLAMNAGTDAAKEAANMVDLDSDPTKLIEVVKIGKQLLITRGSLTTFSFANDVAKYFAIIPALFAGSLPWLKVSISCIYIHQLPPYCQP